MTAEFADLPFKFVSLRDLRLNKLEPTETANTTWENAVSKARFFAKKSGLLTIAEDTGFFVDYLNGRPGVHARRWATTPQERNRKIIDGLKDASKGKRGAYFETSACVYNPGNNSFSVFKGQARGVITRKLTGASRGGLQYDSIFYYPPLKKTFAELPLLEKNKVSHRGKTVNQIKYFLTKQFDTRQFSVPVALIVKDHRMLVLKRRDYREEFNGKWEFPGGAVEYGESIADCLKRETREESGFSVKILEQLPEVMTTVRKPKDGGYQVHLVIFICRVKSGSLKLADNEHYQSGWFSYREALKKKIIPLNKKSFQAPANKKVLLKYIDL